MSNTDNYFGDSPFLENKSEVTGGLVRLKTTTILKNVIVGFLILLILYILYNIFQAVKYHGEDYYQRKTHYYFDNIHGEEFDQNAQLAIEYGEAIPEPRAIDHYRLGTVYLINARQPENAHRHFRHALDHVIEGKTNTLHANFIIDRIDDYKDMFVEELDVDELPIQQAILANFNIMNNTFKNMERKKKEVKIDADDPEFTQKVILSRKDWQTDSQNVHDTAIYTELGNQLDFIVKENCKLKNIQMHTYPEISTWLKTKYRDDEKSLNKVNKVLAHLNHNYPVGSLHGVHEQDIIVNVWRRAYDPRNKANFNAIRDSLADNVLDCVEMNISVCMAGRTAKIWSSLAHLDVNPNIGILRSKQAVRNEIYERCAKIVDECVGKEGSASKQLREAYMADEQTEQVDELKECMIKDINALREHYEELLPSHQLDLIFKECCSVI